MISLVHRRETGRQFGDRTNWKKVGWLDDTPKEDSGILAPSVSALFVSSHEVDSLPSLQAPEKIYHATTAQGNGPNTSFTEPSETVRRPKLSFFFNNSLWGSLIAAGSRLTHTIN